MTSAQQCQMHFIFLGWQPTCGMVCHGLGQHGLATTWRSVHKDTPGWVDANLRKEMITGEDNSQKVLSSVSASSRPSLIWKL